LAQLWIRRELCADRKGGKVSERSRANDSKAAGRPAVSWRTKFAETQGAESYCAHQPSCFLAKARRGAEQLSNRK